MKKRENPIVSALFSLLCYSQFLRRRRRREMEISRENSELVPTSNVNTIAGDEEVEVNDTPIEEVRLTVPIKDDPNEPTLTFRTWVLGISCCCVLSFVNQFLGYKQNRLAVGSVLAQILTLPLGKLMAATLPKGHFRFPFTKWSFTMNPGPFSVKEHVLITIFANSGASSVYAMSVLTIVKAYYHRYINPVTAMLLVFTTQMLGYGWAGMFRRYLVDSPYMWWPSNLVQVSLFRSLHEKEKRPRQGLTRLQFFVMFLICSFVYNIVPAYLFHSISALSFVCWIWKDSITAHQVGSGLHGLGIGSIGLDWSTAAGFLGSPLAVPGFAIINILAGFFLIVYIVIPIAYWCNAYEAKRFPLFSSHTFDSSGKAYNLSRIINSQTFDIDVDAYNSYSKLYLSTVFAFSYGLSFATLMATISHVVLFNGKNIWQMWKKTARSRLGDVHTRIMSKSYEATPQWWFGSILACMVTLALFTCEGFGNDLQLRWWGVLLACFTALFFTLPVGVIKATTNMEPGLNVITELIIGYLYPGKPLANVVFKTYGYSSMTQALTFLQDLKLGTYMKIPPKDMFIVQLVSSVVASTCYFGTGWYLLTTVENICNPAMLPKGSPWTCPGDDVFYNASIIWGVVGPLRMFTKLGNYPELNWFFLIGALAPVPVWLLSCKFPNKEWIKLISMPLILGATHNMPPARSVNFLTWGAVGVLFNIYIYGKCKKWWARHNYVLSAALDAGVAFNGIVLFFALQSNGILGPSWWGLETEDHCPLATCPTAPGIVAQNCPIL